MKKFMEELARTKKHLRDSLPTDTEAQRKGRELQAMYTKMIGKRALYTSKVEKDSRVVVIKDVTKHYVRVSYKYYGRDYEGEISACITYLGLICGDDRLDIND